MTAPRKKATKPRGRERRVRVPAKAKRIRRCDVIGRAIATEKRLDADGEWEYVTRYFVNAGRGMVEVTEKEFDRLSLYEPRLKCRHKELERKQGGRRGEHGNVPAAGKCWPLKSEALAVHPDQVAEATARNKAHGVNVSYDPKWGTAIIPDEGAYKRLRRLEAVHHRNCYDD